MRPSHFFSALFCLVICVIVSCDPVPIDVQMPDGSTRMVVNSYFTSDSAWSVSIVQGQHVLYPTQDQTDITNAQVLIMEDGHLLTTLFYRPPDPRFGLRNGDYRSQKDQQIVPKQGHTYGIIVQSDGFPTMSAECAIPSPVEIGEVQVVSWVGEDHFRIPIIVKFRDRPGEENFYELLVRTGYRDRGADPDAPVHFGFESPVSTEDPLFVQGTASPDLVIDPSKSALPVLFSDSGLDGRELKISGTVYLHPFGISPDQEVLHQVVLRTLSKEYFQYRSTHDLQNMTESDPFAQPVQVYSNVKDGFGIFAGYSQAVKAME